MFVTDEEAAAIYAKACRSWYGLKARSTVKSKIRMLSAKDDAKGVKAWGKVLAVLEREERARSLRHRRPLDGISRLATRFRMTLTAREDHAS